MSVTPVQYFLSLSTHTSSKQHLSLDHPLQQYMHRHIKVTSEDLLPPQRSSHPPLIIYLQNSSSILAFYVLIHSCTSGSPRPPWLSVCSHPQNVPPQSLRPPWRCSNPFLHLLRSWSTLALCVFVPRLFLDGFSLTKTCLNSPGYLSCTSLDLHHVHYRSPASTLLSTSQVPYCLTTRHSTTNHEICWSFYWKWIPLGTNSAI